MAPAAVDTANSTINPRPTKAATKRSDLDLSIFPDGIKTSGQQPPLYNLLQPYRDFPKQITGPTLWSAAEYASHPERWTHPFSPAEISELSAAADSFIASGTPLTGIDKSNFILPTLAPSLAAMRAELLNGKGFILYRDLPVTAWGAHKSAVAYLGLGVHIGYPVSQNGRGHILGHVKDLGEDAGQIDRVRIYRTNARQFFHADDSDVVGLLCMAKAAEGGESDGASTHAVWNILQEERPDVAELLTRPIWYFDRKGEVSEGEEEWIRKSVVMLERPEEGQGQRVYCWYDPYYLRSLARFSDAGLIPALSVEQKEAMTVLEETCERVKLHMVLEVGDIQFLSNTHVLHARTAYKDWTDSSVHPRRHLMRLWLALPEGEGGWRLPYPDSAEKKRGGIQVNDQPPIANLDAD